MKYFLFLLTFASLSLSTLSAQTNAELMAELKAMRSQISNLRHQFDQIDKSVDDVVWYNKVGDVAFIDKVTLTGPPLGDKKFKATKGNGNPLYYQNPLRIQTYLFIPKDIDPNKKYPLMVLPHGGVHSNFNSFYAHIIRELVAQQYIVVAPEYRGSTGYGSGYYRAIDYGGLEVEDVKACRDYMIESYDIVDEKRVGIMGWSHGGLITLMNLFDYNDDYKVGYAGVPVSDLIARMGYKTQGYRELYSVDYHIGKSAYQDTEEYKRRSPAWQADRLNTPLLVHTNTNDSDVNVLEVEHLIKSLKAAEKDFEYQIYEDIPGGHTFDRIDTNFAREVRLKIYRFLGAYLNPPKPFADVKALKKAGYGY
ncbi:MAG: alpha/beta fold hydrolase [Saprospiraceae bacterium]